MSATENIVIQGECPVCSINLNARNINVCVIPCREGHLICRNCIQNIYENGPFLPSRQCWILGVNCPLHKRHFSCPVCHDVFHLRNDSTDNIYIWMRDYSTRERALRRQSIRHKTIEQSERLIDVARQVIQELRNLIVELNEHTRNIRISTITGASVGAAGGTMFIVGGILTFFTLGAAAPLMIAGGAMAAAGGTTAAGSGIANLVITKKTKDKTEELWKRVQAYYIELVDLVLEIEIDDARSILTTVTGNLNTAGKIAGVITLAGMATNATTDVAVPFRIAGTVAGRILTIAGMVFSGVLLVFDIISIVWNAVELTTNKPADFCNRIEEAIEKIQHQCIDVAVAIIERLSHEEK